MSVSGSISFVSATTSSITVSWYITTTSSGFVEAGGSGAGQTLFDYPFGAGKPISGSATVSGLSPGTSYSFSWFAMGNDNSMGGGSYSFSTEAGAPPFFPPSFIPPPVWSDNSVFGYASKGQSYSDGVSASGSPTYSIISGSLPSGISLNSSTGAITGTPTTLGTSNFTVQAANGGGSITAALSIEVILAFSLGLTQGSVGETSFTFGYLADNELNGSSASVSFSVAPSGSISSPTTFTVNAGAFSNGTRTVSGLSPATTYTVTGTMTSGGDTYTDTLQVTTTTPAPAFTDETIVGQATTTAYYSDGVSATYATSYTLSTGSLPPGISLNTSTGALTGTPTTPGSYVFSISAINASGSDNTGNLYLTVYGDLTSQISVSLYNLTDFLDDYFQAQSCSFTLYASNDSDVTGTLTLSVSPSATISGATTYTVAYGGGEVGPTIKTLGGMDHGRSYTVTATLTLSGGIASVSDTLTVERLPYTFSTPNPGVEDCLYDDFGFEVVSYSPVTFSIASGSLPPGLSLGSAIEDTETYYNNSYTASVTGTPTTAGTYSFTIRATNSEFWADVSREIVVSVAEDSGLVLSMFSLSVPVEDTETGLYSVNFILEIDASEVGTSGSGGLLEVIDYPSATFNDDSFEFSFNSLEQRNITLSGLQNNTTYTVQASITVNCYETTATLEVTVGVLPTGGLRVMVDGDWKFGVIRVKDGGEWKLGNLRVKTDGVWKLSQ
jgi:hypothetical protein